MSDLVERLRKAHESRLGPFGRNPVTFKTKVQGITLYAQAADEIEQLQTRNKALEAVAEAAEPFQFVWTDDNSAKELEEALAKLKET